MAAPKKKRSPLVKFMDDFASHKPTLSGRVVQLMLGSYLAVNFAAAVDAFQTIQTNDIAQKTYDTEMAAFETAQLEYELAVNEYLKPKPVFEPRSIVVEENGKAKTQLRDGSGVMINIVTSKTQKLDEEERKPFDLIQPIAPEPYTPPAEWHPRTSAESVVLPGRWLGKALYEWTYQPS